MPGQLSVRQRLPLIAPSRTLPSASTSCGFTPGRGLAQEPGLSGVAPGSGLIRQAPVSVCHQVSTIGQRPSPTTRWYQSQASGLIGSPTVPTRRIDLREGFFTGSSPSRLGDPSAGG